MKPLRIALTKGRLERDTVGLFEEMGLDCSALREKGRKLILPVGNGEIEAVLAKAADVITYVEHGVCDLGVVGKDTILENGTARFFSPLSVDSFIKKSSFIYYTENALREAKDPIASIAQAEGLTAHAHSIQIRF